MRYLFAMGFFFAISNGLLIALSTNARADNQTQPSPVPLAYVRRLLVLPVAMVAPTDAPLPPRPPVWDKKAIRLWEERRKARESFVQLRMEAVRQVEVAILARLRQLTGINLVSGTMAHASAVWHKLQQEPNKPFQTPIVIQLQDKDYIQPSLLAEVAHSAEVDASLALIVDRFGTHSGLEKEVRLRIVAYLMPAERATLRGPFYVYGWAKSARQFFRRGYQKTDEQLAREASVQVARQLAHVLETGEEPPFTRDERVAIVPAYVPQEIHKQTENRGETFPIPIPSLIRQSDVLLQLDIGPFAEICDPDEVKGVLRSQRRTPMDFWSIEGRPDPEPAKELAQKLRAEYVLLSRIRHLELIESHVVVQEAGQPRKGIERRAEAEVEGAILRIADAKVIWQDRVVGATTARTEYVRHEPRLRTDEQTVLDAVRTAYAYLRFSFDSYRRKFER
jgi:hypothetical protein